MAAQVLLVTSSSMLKCLLCAWVAFNSIDAILGASILRSQTLANNAVSLTSIHDTNYTSIDKNVFNTRSNSSNTNRTESTFFPLLRNIVSISRVGSVFLADVNLLYEQRVNFKLAFDEVFSLRDGLRSLNPASFGDFDKLQGKFEQYVVSKDSLSLGAAKLRCEQIGGSLISLHILGREKLSINDTILLSDKFRIMDSDVKCYLDALRDNGVTCLTTVRNWATALGLKFYDSLTDNELFDRMLSFGENAVLHLSVNSTHLGLTHKNQGRAVCSFDKSNETDDSFSDLVRDKYFIHLNTILSAVIDKYEKEISHLFGVFLSMSNEVPLAFNARVSQKDKCLFLQRSQPVSCIGSGHTEFSDFDSFFDNRKKLFVGIDSLLFEYAAKARSMCTGASSSDELFIDLVFNGFMSLHAKMDMVMAKSIGRSHSAQGPSYYIEDTTSSIDYKHCLVLSLADQPSDQSLINLSDALYNMKLHLCFRFPDCPFHWTFLEPKPIDSFRHLPTLSKAKLPNIERHRRWIFTNPLSFITGLAEKKDIDSLSMATMTIKAREDNDVKEIHSLDLRANAILTAIKTQNSKVEKLFDDDHLLHNHLQALIADKKLVSSQLSHLTKGIEALSDISIAHSSFMSSLSLWPHIIAEINAQTLSLIAQTLPPELAPQGLGSASIRASLAGSSLKAVCTADDYLISYSIPRVVDEFALFSAKGIYFPLEGSYHALNLGNALVAVNNNGHTIVPVRSDCVTTGKDLICEASIVDTHVVPLSCLEALALKPFSLPALCVSTMLVLAPLGQSFIHQDNSHKVSLSTTFNDTISIQCLGNASTHAISPGVSIFELFAGCTAFTKHLVIRSSAKIVPAVQQFSTVWNLGFAQSLLDLSEDLAYIHEVNMTTLGQDFAKYAYVTNVERLDITSAKAAIASFNSIKKLEEYNPTKLDLNTLQDLSGTTTVTAWVVLAVVLFLLAKCCKSCCCLSNIPCCRLVRSAFSCTLALSNKLIDWTCPAKTCTFSKDRSAENTVELEDSEPMNTCWTIVSIGHRKLLTVSLPSGTLFLIT